MNIKYNGSIKLKGVTTMKRFATLIIALSFMLTGCEGININIDLSSLDIDSKGSQNKSDKKTNKGQMKKAKYGALGIPQGHLPTSGMCRIWIPGVPPGKQDKQGSCSTLKNKVPKGAWLLSTPAGTGKGKGKGKGKNKNSNTGSSEVSVSVYDNNKIGVVLEIRHYNGETGAFLSVNN